MGVADPATGARRAEPGDDAAGYDEQLQLIGWRSRAVVGVALIGTAAGFGSFGAVAALGDVARTFGHVHHGLTIAEQAGLSGTVVGLGLAVLRLASLAGLPLAALADRYGRRPVLLVTCALGLLCTVVAAAAPTYWWFVGLFALGRPLLSATGAVSQVAAAELTTSRERAKAVSLVAAGYAVGAGTTAVVYSLGKSVLGFRGVFALAVVPLVCLVFIARMVVEPDRYRAMPAPEHRRPVLGPVGPEFRSRLAIVAIVTFSVSVITGPANSFVFIYAQNVLHLAGAATAAMVVVAGITGFAGLLLGRAMADGMGRRPTAVLATVGLGGFGILLYSGSTWALLFGYVLGIAAGGMLAPAAGAFVNELFPTAVRGSVAGWILAAGVLGAVSGLVAFGALADAGNRFSVGALITFLPAVPFVALVMLLPETKGREPEQLWGAHGSGGPSGKVAGSTP
jgi:MFS family permease